MESKDYLDEDGILCCGVCHGRKKRTFDLLGRSFSVDVPCRCEAERMETEARQEKMRAEREEADRLRRFGIHDRELINCSFEKDDGTVRQMESARRYVAEWSEDPKENTGLLLWGDVGTGKTFYAGCIANALIDRQVPVMMTSFPKIINAMSPGGVSDKNRFIRDLVGYPLLIIDDLGIERQSEFAMEVVYNVIDERYKTGWPLIVTTNLSLNKISNPDDMTHLRIYDRISAMCVPVRFDGPNHRKQQKEQRFKDAGVLFG